MADNVLTRKEKLIGWGLVLGTVPAGVMLYHGWFLQATGIAYFCALFAVGLWAEKNGKLL